MVSCVTLATARQSCAMSPFWSADGQRRRRRWIQCLHNIIQFDDREYYGLCIELWRCQRIRWTANRNLIVGHHQSLLFFLCPSCMLPAPACVVASQLVCGHTGTICHWLARPAAVWFEEGGNRWWWDRELWSKKNNNCSRFQCRDRDRELQVEHMSTCFINQVGQGSLMKLIEGIQIYQNGINIAWRTNWRSPV